MSLCRVCSAQPPWRRQRSDIAGHSAGTRRCCPRTHRDVSAWSCSLSLVLPFPLLPCPDVLDLLADISSSLANGIIGILIFFLVFLLPCAFGDFSITSGLLPHPLSITAAAQLLGELPIAPSFLHQAAGNNLLLTPPSLLSCSHSSQSGMPLSLQMFAYTTRLWTAFSVLHMGTEDMAIIPFQCSDITGDKSQQRICRQDLNDLFYIRLQESLFLLLLYTVHHFQCRQPHSFWLL